MKDTEKTQACPKKGCTKMFTTDRHAMRHVEMLHCKHCDRGFERSMDRITHQNTCSMNQLAGKEDQVLAFECEVEDCSRIFGTRDNMLQHVRTMHQNERPHQCSHCLRGFVRSSNRNVHQLRCQERMDVLEQEDCSSPKKSACDVETQSSQHNLPTTQSDLYTKQSKSNISAQHCTTGQIIPVSKKIGGDSIYDVSGLQQNHNISQHGSYSHEHRRSSSQHALPYTLQQSQDNLCPEQSYFNTYTQDHPHRWTQPPSTTASGKFRPHEYELLSAQHTPQPYVQGYPYQAPNYVNYSAQDTSFSWNQSISAVGRNQTSSYINDPRLGYGGEINQPMHAGQPSHQHTVSTPTVTQSSSYGASYINSVLYTTNQAGNYYDTSQLQPAVYVTHPSLYPNNGNRKGGTNSTENSDILYSVPKNQFL